MGSLTTLPSPQHESLMSPITLIAVTFLCIAGPAGAVVGGQLFYVPSPSPRPSLLPPVLQARRLLLLLLLLLLPCLASQDPVPTPCPQFHCRLGWSGWGWALNLRDLSAPSPHPASAQPQPC